MNSRLLVISLAMAPASTALALAAGSPGYTGARPSTCVACHNGGAAKPTVTLTGPLTLAPDEIQKYTLTVTGGPGANAGLGVATSGGELQADPESPATKLMESEIVNSIAAPMPNGTATFTFYLKAPRVLGPVTLYASGFSGNGDALTPGDSETTVQLALTVAGPLVPSGNNGSMTKVVQAAAASENPVLQRTTTLSVQVDGGGRPLTYEWVAAGPGKVEFSRNGNAESNVTDATFSASGEYRFRCDVRDSSGIVTTSTGIVTVDLGDVAAPGGQSDNSGGTGCMAATSQRTGAASLSLLAALSLALRRLRRRR